MSATSQRLELTNAKRRLVITHNVLNGWWVGLYQHDPLGDPLAVAVGDSARLNNPKKIGSDELPDFVVGAAFFEIDGDEHSRIETHFAGLLNPDVWAAA